MSLPLDSVRGLLFLCLVTGAAWSKEKPAACTDTERMDLRNTQLHLKQRVLALVNGRNEELLEPGAGVDWETTVLRDELISVPRVGAVRLLLLERAHLAGTGEFGIVVVLRCRGGKVERLFELEEEGLRARWNASRERLEVSKSHWGPKDAHCCPSELDLEEYEGDGAATFKRVGQRREKWTEELFRRYEVDGGRGR